MTPIAPNLWTDEPEPRLIGGLGPDGRVRFPAPDGADPVPLSREGKLWSWTVQRFEPKRPPYAGPTPFEPFMLGYVELPEAIVEARLVGIDAPEIGMPLTLTIVPFDGERATFAFTRAA